MEQGPTGSVEALVGVAPVVPCLMPRVACVASVDTPAVRAGLADVAAIRVTAAEAAEDRSASLRSIANSASPGFESSRLTGDEAATRAPEGWDIRVTKQETSTPMATAKGLSTALEGVPINLQA